MKVEKGEAMVVEPQDDMEKVTGEVDTATGRGYELRDLKDKDVFLMLKILKKVGIGNFKQAFYQMVSEEKAVKDIGIDVALDMADILIGNIENAEKEIYSLWGELSGLEPKEIKEMEFGTLPLMIMDTFSRARNTSFFRVVSKLLQ